jgi:hypothetical protein
VGFANPAPDDDAGGVGAGVAGEALDLERGVENLLCRLVPLHELDDVARRPRVLIARHVPVLAGREYVRSASLDAEH